MYVNLYFYLYLYLNLHFNFYFYLVKHENSVILVGARGLEVEVTNWDVTQSMVPPSHPATNALDRPPPRPAPCTQPRPPPPMMTVS